MKNDEAVYQADGKSKDSNLNNLNAELSKN
jgi:hypothetical protein